MRQAVIESELDQRQLLSRQRAQRFAQTLGPLGRVDTVIAGAAWVGNVEERLDIASRFPAPSLDVDASIASNVENPGTGGRFRGIEQMRLAPDRLHHILRRIGGGESVEPEPDHLGVHARAEMIEQDGKGSAIVIVADGGEKLIEIV